MALQGQITRKVRSSPSPPVLKVENRRLTRFATRTNEINGTFAGGRPNHMQRAQKPMTMLTVVRAPLLGAFILAGCATAEQSATTQASPQVSYAQGSPSEEDLGAKLARLEQTLAKLQLDYSALKPEMQRVIARDGSLAYRITAIEETMGFTTASVPSTVAEQPAPATPSAAQPAQAAAAASTETTFGLHLASYREEAALQTGWQDLLAANRSLLEGFKPMSRTFDAGKDGIYRRLIVGPMADLAEAKRLCASLKERGTWCQPHKLSAQ